MATTETETVQNIKEKIPDIGFFGVYDGHAGEACSEYLSKEIVERVSELEDPTDPESLVQVALRADHSFLKRFPRTIAGSTGVVAVVKPLFPQPDTMSRWNNKRSFDQEELPVNEQKHNQMKENEEDEYLNIRKENAPSNIKSIPSDAHPLAFHCTISNVGDSRALLIRKNGNWVALTKDHLPTNPFERARIRKANGTVSLGRVDGELAMSRAFGDVTYKLNNQLSFIEQKVIPLPDVTVVVAEPGDMLLLCCDGIYERLTRKQVAEFVHHEIAIAPQEPGRTVCRLIDWSLQRGSGDNMSAILVLFKTEEQANNPISKRGSGIGLMSDQCDLNVDQYYPGEPPTGRLLNNRDFMEIYKADKDYQIRRLKESKYNDNGLGGNVRLCMSVSGPVTQGSPRTTPSGQRTSVP